MVPPALNQLPLPSARPNQNMSGLWDWRFYIDTTVFPTGTGEDIASILAPVVINGLTS